MINELDKNILKKIILAEHPISGQDISYMCHISINTLRKEIDIINDFLQPYGCHIDTKISIGYSIIIDDESIARPFLFRLLKEINRYSYLNISSSQKENYIIRRLLTSSRPIALDTLINELYYSKSTILRNIDKIKDYLKLFNLEIKVKRKEGFYIDGKEWNKRMCLIHQHKIYTHSRYDALNVDLSEDQSFINTFLTDTDYSNKLKTLFLSIAPNYPTLSFAHIDLAMIFNFIILCKTRHDKSNELFFTEEQLNYVHNSTTYALAKEMIDSIPSYFLIDFTQNEIDAFAILLEGIRKYNNPNYFTSTELISLREETMNLLMFISERYYIDDIIDEQLILDLCCFIKEHKLLHLFEIYKDDESFTFINRSGIFTSDLCARIALYLDKNANMPLNLDFISRVYSIFNRALYENRVFFKSQNFLVISRYSTYFAKNIATRIKDIYKRNVKLIDVCEYTDIPNANIDKYDAIITDINSSLISIGMPIIEYDFNRDKHDFESLNLYFNQLYLNHSLEIFKECDYHKETLLSKDQVIEFIFDSLAIPDISKDEWINDCLKREKYISFEREKDIVLITNLTYVHARPIFKVIVNSEPIPWDKSDGKIFIYYNHSSRDIKNSQIISYLIKQFLQKNEQYLNTLEGLTYEEVIKNFK